MNVNPAGLRAVGPTALAAASATAASVLAVSLLPPPAVLIATAAALLLALLVAVPWAAVPVIVIGGTIADQVLGLDTVAAVLELRSGLIAICIAALVLRRLGGDSWGPRVHTGADPFVIALAGAIAIGAAWGLARGNEAHEVLVASAHLLALPVYFFLATLTLNRPGRFWAAARLYCVGALIVAILAYTAPGRQGGLISTIALAGAVAIAFRPEATAAERWILLAASAIFLSDIALSGYRAVWLASGVGMLLLVLWLARSRWAIIGAGALALVAALVVASIGDTPVEERAGVASDQIGASSGYRLPEADVGLGMVREAPLLGAGLGRVEPDAYLATLGYADVGPVFHAFYLTVAVNLGLLGLLLVIGFLAVSGVASAGRPAAASRSSRGRADPERDMAIAFSALLGGWAVAALFAAPTDGHWELGLLAAAALVAGSFARSSP